LALSTLSDNMEVSTVNDLKKPTNQEEKKSAVAVNKSEVPHRKFGIS
jgi:sulfur carrier protein ThiS